MTRRLLTILLILTGCSYAPTPTVTPAPPRARVPYVLPLTEASVVTDGCWQQTSRIIVEGMAVWWEPDTARYKACVKQAI